jgi:hypothetical protein
MVFRRTKKRSRLSRKLKRLSKQTGGKIPFSKLKKKTKNLKNSKKRTQLRKRKHFRRDSRPDPQAPPSHKKI